MLFGKQEALESLFCVLYHIYAEIYEACSLSNFFFPMQKKNEREMKQRENLEVFHFFN